MMNLEEYKPKHRSDAHEKPCNLNVECKSVPNGLCPSCIPSLYARFSAKHRKDS